MELSITTSKITGNPGASGWAQVHEFRPDEEEKLAKRGELLAVIATSKESAGVDRVVAGREILARLHEEYFGELEKPAFYALKEAVESVIKEFSNLWGEVQIAAAAIVGGVVYSTVGGGAEAAVFRDGMLAKILASEPGGIEGVISASGYPKESDIFLLGTKPFFEILPQGVIKAAFEGENLEQGVEAIVPFIHSRPDTGAVGAVLIKFSKEEVFVSKIDSQGGEPPQQEEISAPLTKDEVTSRPKLKGNFVSIFENVANTFSRFVGRRLPERKIYVRAQGEEIPTGQNRKLAISVGTILLILLLVSIGFGIRQKNIKEHKLTYESRLNQAKHDLREAENLYSLDPIRARELFASAESLVTDLENEGIKDSDVNELKKQIDDKEGFILGIYRASPELFIDLSILSSGLKGDDLAAGDEKVFVLDKSGKKVVSVAFATKKTEVVAGPDQISKADFLANYGNRVFVLSDDGIEEVGDTAKKVVKKNWDGGAIPYTYTGNLYLIDEAAKTIWRYPGGADGFGTRSKWNTQDLDFNLNNLAGVSIDGSIWLLTNSGEVYRYSMGNKLNFSISGLLPELTSATAIYSNENLKYLYILDRVGKRVVVVDKSGEYKAQYTSDLISEATDLAVSESTKKIILLSGSKLYSIEIKHL